MNRYLDCFAGMFRFTGFVKGKGILGYIHMKLM